VEDLGELRERVKASRRGEGSLGEADDGPKIRRSLSSEGVRGRGKDISSSSGRGKRGGCGCGILFLGLRYGSRGSFSISPILFAGKWLPEG
jgi:hypothetical protein